MLEIIDYCLSIDRTRVFRLIGLFVLLVGHGVSPNSVRGQQEDPVASYLQSLRLQRLLIRHLENEVASELDTELRLSKARQLVELYSDQLLDTSTPAASIEGLMDRVDALLKVYPSLLDRRIRIALLQSRFRIAEKKFREWWLEVPRKKTEEQFAIWNQLRLDLEQLDATLQLESERIAVRIQLDRSDPIALGQMDQIEQILMHSSFLSGWSSYFCGVIDPENRRRWFRSCDEKLREFLQIDSDKSLTELTTNWVDFDLLWQDRALIGLGLCHRGLAHPKQSNHCFRLLRQETRGAAKTQVYVWDLYSRLFIGDYNSIQTCIERLKFDAEIATGETVGFWVVVLRSSSDVKQYSPSVASDMQREALIGLTLSWNDEIIKAHVADQEMTWTDDFYGNWIAGYLATTKLDSAGEDQFKNTRETLERALRQVDSGVDKKCVAHCQYLLARVYYGQKEFRLAARLFQVVSSATEVEDRVVSAEAQWMAAKSLQRDSQTNPDSSGMAFLAFDNLVRRFPESSYTRKAKFEKMKLNLAGLPTDVAIRRLNAIGRSDANFGAAQYEIARIRYRAWLSAMESGSSDLMSRLNELDAAEKVVRNDESLPSAQKLKCLLFLIDALIRTEPMNSKEIESCLLTAEQFVGRLGNDSPAVIAEYHYYRMNYFYRGLRFQAAEREADWLIKNAASTPYYRSALIQMGRLIDSRINEDPSLAAKTIDRRLQIYRKLVKEYGETDRALANSKNARAAYYRLGTLEREAGNDESAEIIFRKLLELFPNHQVYLRQLGLVLTNQKRWQSAIPVWRTLCTGVQPGSELWFEAKYELVHCLSQTDPKLATSVLRQTIQLSPELPSNWKSKYLDMQSKLPSSKPKKAD